MNTIKDSMLNDLAISKNFSDLTFYSFSNEVEAGLIANEAANMLKYNFLYILLNQTINLCNLIYV